VHVEAVANVVGRAEMMAATFVLSACVLWPLMKQRAARAATIAILYLLALASKESAAVLPALLVMLDCADGQWSFPTLPQYLKRRAPELSALVVTFALYMVLRTSIVGGIGPSRLDPSIEVIDSGFARILTALQAWPIMARVFFFPVTLLADYGPRILLPINTWNSLAVLGVTMVIALVGGGVIAITKERGVWALALLWFPIAILPVSNFLIPIGVLLAERTLYLPSVALAFLFAGLLTATRRHVAWRPLGNVLAVVVPLLFAVRTTMRVPEWKSTDSILLALVRDRPDAFRGQWHKARIARARGDVEVALQTYDQALKLWPFREGLVKEAAAYGSGQGRAAWARDVAFYGTQRWPNTVEFHRIVAGNALDLGDTATAVRTLRKALQLHPRDTILNDMWRAATVTTSK
jgi:protein O-mannosyl-transferase